MFTSTCIRESGLALSSCLTLVSFCIKNEINNINGRNNVNIEDASETEEFVSRELCLFVEERR